MPIFLDRHELTGFTAADVAEAHQKDLAIQEKHGVCFLTYWFDAERGTAFCLIDAPDAATAHRVHQEAHGATPSQIIPVDLSAVQAFLGRIADPTSSANSEPIAEIGLRTVMFTDIVNSTEMTERLGDERAVEMVRAHDAIVRQALKDIGGREVKHTGDGIMAAFDEASQAIESSCVIMQRLDAFNRQSNESLNVRIGVHAGEPVRDNNDLFGKTVQLASRICQDASVNAIVVSDEVFCLAKDRFKFTDLGLRMLKGFSQPVPLYSVNWH